MGKPGQITTRYPRWPWCGRYRSAVAIVLIAGCLSACTTTDFSTSPTANLPPLQLPDYLVTAEQAYERTPTPDLLAVDQDMREFVQRYTGDVRQERQRLMMLHRAIRGAAILGMEYDPQADGAARDIFRRGSANCLAYATLFVALAREAGLNASYQRLEVRPQWARQGERLVVRMHVNALVSLRGTEQYMVDIDPLPSRDIVAAHPISDTEAAALHHSNLAMSALADHDTEQAWLHAVRALQLSPGTAHLWVNLGVVYRANGQHNDAERSYLHALQLDPGEQSAMNNLVVLYGIEGRQSERALWAMRVARYREENPYYHAWLGDEAAGAGDWSRAVNHYERALALAPDDSQLLFDLGQSHEQLGEFAIASGYLQRAIATATEHADITVYRQQLHSLPGSPASGS
jgi:Flp pilus assembly protein TadD